LGSKKDGFDKLASEKDSHSKFFKLMEQLIAIGTADPERDEGEPQDGSGLVNAPNRNGETPLMVAACSGTSTEVMIFLLARKANVNAKNKYVLLFFRYFFRFSFSFLFFFFRSFILIDILFFLKIRRVGITCCGPVGTSQTYSVAA